MGAPLFFLSVTQPTGDDHAPYDYHSTSLYSVYI